MPANMVTLSEKEGNSDRLEGYNPEESGISEYLGDKAMIDYANKLRKHLGFTHPIHEVQDIMELQEETDISQPNSYPVSPTPHRWRPLFTD